jgi:hypothetical protein
MMAIQFLKFARMYRKALVMQVSPADVSYFLNHAVPAVLGKAEPIPDDTVQELREAAGAALEAFAEGLRDGAITIHEAGCCTRQGAIPVGWSIILGKWEIRIHPKDKRPHCGNHWPRNENTPEKWK